MIVITAMFIHTEYPVNVCYTLYTIYNIFSQNICHKEENAYI